ncbi:MAG: hypothetical protein GY839_13610 [candidate division Zixibacteria bacterium]|nr:hypothetical protein [candidate division Zixibacteria bacterium]
MKVSSLCWGVVFLGAGLFFLFINMGYLDHYVWVRLLALWPIALIAIGLALIFNKTKLKYLAFTAPLLFALAFVWVAFSEWGYCRSFDFNYKYNSRSSANYGREVYEYVVESDPEVKRLDVDLDFGLGELWVGGTSNTLFNGDFEYRRSKPNCKYKTVGDEGRIEVRSRDLRGLNIFRKHNFKNDARIFIADYLPLELTIDIGAASVDLDLSEHKLKKLNLDTGAAEVDLRLGCGEDDLEIDIDSGASDITIIIPHDMGLEIDADVALSSTNFRRAGLEKVRGIYRSDNFNSAECKATISIDSGVSEIKIQYY